MYHRKGKSKKILNGLCRTSTKISWPLLKVDSFTRFTRSEKIPKASKKIDVKKGTFYEKGDTIISYVDVDFADYRKSIDNKIVRRNVSLPNWMDRAAEREKLNVSKILQDAIYALIGKKYSANYK